MKKAQLSKVLIALFVFSLLLLAFFTIAQNRLFFNVFSGKGKSADTIPTSYEECYEWLLRNTSFDPAGKTVPFCQYLVAETSALYQQCVSRGGIELEPVCMNCPGCGCSSAGCELVYINDDFRLPTSFTECRNTTAGGIGKNVLENNGREYCSIEIPGQGVFNKDVSERLLRECFSRNGKEFIENTSCELRFYK